jgi:hypothetical protein
MDINSVPRVTITWLDARDMETGWLDIKEILAAPLAGSDYAIVVRGPGR